MVQKTHQRWYVCADRTYHKACNFRQTSDAILYLNNCSCAPILNFSPKCPTGGSTKRGISNRIFLAIFAAIFCGFWCTLWHQSQKVDSFWMAYALCFRGVFCRYCIDKSQRSNFSFGKTRQLCWTNLFAAWHDFPRSMSAKLSIVTKYNLQ